jgi:Flp pilus assembly protein TadG
MRLNRPARLARHRQGQSTVEVMLVISVLVVAIVAAGFVITNENNGFIAGMRAMSDGAGTVFAKKPD